MIQFQLMYLLFLWGFQKNQSDFFFSKFCQPMFDLWSLVKIRLELEELISKVTSEYFYRSNINFLKDCLRKCKTWSIFRFPVGFCSKRHSRISSLFQNHFTTWVVFESWVQKLPKSTQKTQESCYTQSHNLGGQSNSFERREKNYFNFLQKPSPMYIKVPSRYLSFYIRISIQQYNMYLPIRTLYTFWKRYILPMQVLQSISKTFYI